MTDYDALVKRLREHGEFLIVSDRIKAPPNVNVRNVFAEDYYQAADAIEELKNNYDTVTSVQKHVIENQRNKIKNLRNDLDFAIRAEAAAIEACKPRWIPVTERLPEDLTRVIVFCEDGVSYGLCEHLIADDEEVVEWHDFLHYPITPTHWMPLPEPPKEET